MGKVDSDDPLISRAHPEITEDSMTLGEVFNSNEPAVQKGLRTAVLTQAFQQCSGINAVSLAFSRRKKKKTFSLLTKINFV